MKDSYGHAVNFVAETFKGRVVGGQIKSHPAEPSELLFKFALRIEQNFEGGMTRYIYPEGAAESLCMKAESDKGAFDLLSRIVASKLFRGEPLSETLRTFAGLVVAGIKKSPKGSKAAHSVVVNLHLVVTAKAITSRFGLPLTRNDASPPLSACDAVVDGLAVLGHTRSWRSIKELLVHQTSASLRSLEEEIRALAYKNIEDDPSILEKWKSDSARATGDGDH